MIEIVTPPATHAVSLGEVKTWVRIDQNVDDALVVAQIVAAQAEFEKQTGLLLIEQTVRLTLWEWPCEIILPRAPVRAVQSITYTDTAGATQTLAGSAYIVREIYGVTRIEPSYSARSWPTLGNDGNIKVTFTAGFDPGHADLIQSKQAIMMKVAALYDERMAGVSAGFDSMVQKLTRFWL